MKTTVILGHGFNTIDGSICAKVLDNSPAKIKRIDDKNTQVELLHLSY